MLNALRLLGVLTIFSLAHPSHAFVFSKMEAKVDREMAYKIHRLCYRQVENEKKENIRMKKVLSYTVYQKSYNDCIDLSVNRIKKDLSNFRSKIP